MSAPVHCSPAGDLPLDDLLLEVFLRLPPEPHHLLAASLVSRRWRRLVRNPAFLRRYRAFHRAPPLLGIFENLWRVTRGFNLHSRRLIFNSVASSMGSFIPPKPDHWALDCRHGRLLLHGSGDQGLLVWDPMAGEAHHVSMPPGSQGLEVAASVLCAAGHDDNTDCQSTPFQIVFLDGRTDGEDQDYESRRLISAYVYSSETDTWGDAAAIISPFPVDMEAASIRVGSSIYWNLELTTTDDGGIGFAGVNNSNLHFWSRRTVPEDGAGWVLTRRIDLNNFTISGSPVGDIMLWSSVAAFAEDSDEIFLQSEAGIFVINIRSLQLRKVLETTGLPIYPYSSFYTRGRDIAGIDDEDEQ